MFLTDLFLILFIFLFQCEWLLSGNRVGAGQDLEEGLDPESPIYKAIMSNPIVQLGLNNPRSLLGKEKHLYSSKETRLSQINLFLVTLDQGQ